jgi:hypothetical protein
MPACPSQTFAHFTPQQFASLERKAQASGIPIKGNTGSGSTLGGQFTWNYDPSAQQLTITVLQPPFLMNCESATARIKAMVEGISA